MNDRIKKTEEESNLLINKFLSGEINADDFCFQYTAMWIRFRDDQEKNKQDWAEPFDQQLVEACLQGKISKEEFNKDFSNLMGLTATRRFHEMIDSIHSACSTYNPLPEYEWEINGDQLKDEVREALARYEHK